MAGPSPSPSLLRPCPAPVDPLGFLHRYCASTMKLKFFLPASSSTSLTGFSQRDCTSTAIATKLKLRYKGVKASLCDLGLESDSTSEPAAETSSSSSYSPSPNLTSERGVFFSTGPSFFRTQSSLGRDLAVLAAALYKRAQGQLRVLDAMSGCGVRALRYLTQSEADYVLANDCNPDLHTTMVENLSRYAPLQGLHCPPSEPRPSAPGNPREPCKMEGFSGEEYVNSTENHSSIENLRSTVNLNMIDNPSKTEILSEAGQVFVDDGSFKCYGSPASERASTTGNPCRIYFTNNSSTENSSKIGAHPLETRNFDHNGSLVTSSATLRSSVTQFPINTCFSGVSNDLQHKVEMGTSPNGVKWQVCHEEAARLLLKCNLNMDFFDFIDVDSFGSDSFFLGPALSALRFGGLLFVTCTDGFSSGGHRPYNSLAQYGTFMKPMPYANELGLRMLMGAVVKEASLRNMTVSPIFSVYAPHGPVFRVLLRASAGTTGLYIIVENVEIPIL